MADRFSAHGETRDGKMQMRCGGEAAAAWAAVSRVESICFYFFFTGSSGGRRGEAAAADPAT